jgi:cytochrome P450
MKTERDEGAILRSIHESMGYGALIGLLPSLHPWLAWFAKITGMRIPFDNILSFLKSQINKRTSPQTQNPDKESGGNDFLTKLLALREKDKVTDHDVVTTLGANVAAGSDTTAISLSSVVYHLMRNDDPRARLREEIGVFEREGKISNPVTWREAQEMPYLQAVIKEALRIHPATGQMLSRVVPPEGAELAGYRFPGGVSFVFRFVVKKKGL